MTTGVKRTLVTLLLLLAGYLLFTQVDGWAILELVGHTEPAPFLLSLPFFLLGLLAHAWRWCVLLPEGVPLRRVFHASNLGHAGNLIIPGRAGEPIRIALLSGPDGGQVGKVTGSVVLERLLEQVFRIVFFVAGLAWLGRGQGGDALVSMLVALAILSLVVLSVRRYPVPVSEGLSLLLRPFFGWSSEKILEQVRSMIAFVEGVGGRQMRVFCLRTLVCWVLLTVHHALVLQSLGVEQWVAQSLLVMAIATPTAATQPVLYHGVLVAGLALVGVPATEGMAWAILLHAVQLVLFPALAGWAYFALGRPGFVSLRE